MSHALPFEQRFKGVKKTMNPQLSGTRRSIREFSGVFRRGSFGRGGGMKDNSSFYSDQESNNLSRDSRMMISRPDFVEYYPQLLLEITTEADYQMGEPDGDDASRGQCPGVDISFQDLSLSIKVGDNVINVVDKVTGRIRAKTMTALMGGSGAGKVSA